MKHLQFINRKLYIIGIQLFRKWQNRLSTLHYLLFKDFGHPHSILLFIVVKFEHISMGRTDLG